MDGTGPVELGLAFHAGHQTTRAGEFDWLLLVFLGGEAGLQQLPGVMFFSNCCEGFGLHLAPEDVDFIILRR